MLQSTAGVLCDISHAQYTSSSSVLESNETKATFEAALKNLSSIYNADMKDLRCQVQSLQARLIDFEQGTSAKASTSTLLEVKFPTISAVTQLAVEEASTPHSEKYPALHHSFSNVTSELRGVAHQSNLSTSRSEFHLHSSTEPSNDVLSTRASEISNTASKDDRSSMIGSQDDRFSVDAQQRISVVSEKFNKFASDDTNSGLHSGPPRPAVRVSSVRHTSSSTSSERLWQADATMDNERVKMMKAKTVSEGRNNSGVRGKSDLSVLSSVACMNLRKKVRGVVNSVHFEAFFAAVIITNSVFLGVRVDISVTHPNNPEHVVIEIIEYAYTTLFTLELILRVFAEGFEVFCLWDRFYWYWLDLFIVGSAIFELVLASIQKSSSGSFDVSNTRTFRVVRITRIIKIIRIARVVRFVRALRVLVLSIVHTMRSVFWAFVLLLIIIYVFGLVFVQVVTDYAQTQNNIDATSFEADLLRFWGTLPRSMFTLYKSISSGISWHEVVTPLSDVHEFLVGLFIVFISFTVFAVLNVITGVFCEAAIESARQDHEMMIQQHLAEKDHFITAMYSIFGLNQDTETSMSYADFETVLKDPKTKARLEVMQLEIEDAWELFKLLDTDDSCYVDVEEFVHGALRLKGMAKAIDIAKLDYETRIRQKRMLKIMHFIDKRLCKIQNALDIPLTVKTLSL